MQRFEVTMADGWKTRVSAETAEAAKAKAERLNRFGDKAVNAEPCEDFKIELTAEERAAWAKAESRRQYTNNQPHGNDCCCRRCQYDFFGL